MSAVTTEKTVQAPVRSLLGRLGAALVRVGIPSVLWVAAVLVAWSFCLMLPARATQEDFTIFYLSGTAVREHRNPYTYDFRPITKRTGWSTTLVTHAGDTPSFILLVTPLARFPIRTAHTIWLLLNFACLALSLFLLFGPGSGIPGPLAWSLVALTVFYPPILGHFYYGQNKFPVLLTLVLAMRWMKRGQEARAGLVLAPSCLMLVFPALTLGYMVIERRWRMTLYALGGIAVGAALTIIFFGAANSLSFIDAIDYLGGYGIKLGLYQDMAINAFFSRSFSHLAHSTMVNHLTVISSVFIARLVTLVMIVRASLTYSATEDPDWRVYCLWIVASAMLSPIVWFHWGVFLLILFAQIATASCQGRCSRRAILMSVVSVALMVWWQSEGASLEWRAEAWPSRILAEGGFFSMVAAFVSAYWFVVDGAPQPPPRLRELPQRLWTRLFSPALTTTADAEALRYS